MDVLKLKNLNNKTINIAFNFLKIFSIETKKLKSEIKQGHTVLPGKVSYFDIETLEYRSYDFLEFNILMTKTYYEYFVEPKINNPGIYWQVKYSFDVAYTKSRYKLYNNVFTSFHLTSWFFKSLRAIENKKNEFEINIIISQFPMPFLEKNASQQDHVDFMIDFFNSLKFTAVVSIQENKIIFGYEKLTELNQLINFSFESLIFGGDVNEDTIKLIYETVEDKVLFDTNISEDYKINYIISKTTNYILYEKVCNNLLIC